MYPDIQTYLNASGRRLTGYVPQPAEPLSHEEHPAARHLEGSYPHDPQRCSASRSKPQGPNTGFKGTGQEEVGYYSAWKPSNFGCGSYPRVVVGPPPLVTNLCRGGCLKPSVADFPRLLQRYYLEVALCFWGFVAEGFVAEQPSPLQTYVTK